MTSIAYSPVNIQASPHSVPSVPDWFGEVTLLAHHLQRQGVLAAIEEQVRFARRRFGRYEVIDFLAVLFGYAASGERTLESFYERLQPWASTFMALFGRDHLPARSTLSRFLAALAPAVCYRLYGAQTRGNRAHSYHRLAGSYSSVACHFWKLWEWGVPDRTAPGSDGHPKLSPGAYPPRSVCPASSRWAIWDRS